MPPQVQNAALSRLLQTASVKERKKETPKATYNSFLDKARVALTNARKKVFPFFKSERQYDDSDDENAENALPVPAEPGAAVRSPPSTNVNQVGVESKLDSPGALGPALDTVQSFHSDDQDGTGFSGGSIVMSKESLSAPILKQDEGLGDYARYQSDRYQAEYVLTSPISTVRHARSHHLSDSGDFASPEPDDKSGTTRRRRLSSILPASAAASLEALYNDVDKVQRSRHSQTRTPSFVIKHGWRSAHTEHPEYRGVAVNKTRRRSLAFSEIDRRSLYTGASPTGVPLVAC